MILRACVRCGLPSEDGYCPEHKPRNYDRSKPFWGGQGANASQRRQRKRILQRDEYVCHWCGGLATQADHVIPQSRGGADTDDNLVASCGPCNLKRIPR